MKLRHRFLPIVLLVVYVLPSLEAQTSVPPNPGKAGKRNLGEGGTANAPAGATIAQRPAEVVRYLAVTKVEAWANSEGRVIEARLLSFSDPAEAEAGPLEIVREGKVRFLVAGRDDPVEYPIDQLGEEERKKIEAIAEVAAKGPPPKN